MQKLCRHPDVHELILDQCMYGLVSRDNQGTAPAKKRTRLITNLCAAEIFLTRQCDGQHRHVHLLMDELALPSPIPLVYAGQ